MALAEEEEDEEIRTILYSMLLVQVSLMPLLSSLQPITLYVWFPIQTQNPFIVLSQYQNVEEDKKYIEIWIYWVSLFTIPNKLQPHVNN